MTAFACCVNARRQPARPATPAERPATPARHPRQGLDGSDLEPQLAHTLTFTRCAAVAERLLGRPVEHRFDHAIYKPAFQRRGHVLAPGRGVLARAEDPH